MADEESEPDTVGEMDRDCDALAVKELVGDCEVLTDAVREGADALALPDAEGLRV